MGRVRLTSDRRGAAVVWLVGAAALIVSAMTLVLEIGWLNLCRSEVRVIAENAAPRGGSQLGPGRRRCGCSDDSQAGGIIAGHQQHRGGQQCGVGSPGGRAWSEQ